MIKNLVVNGCSFSDDTWNKPPTWATFIHKNLQFDHYQNLARTGAGNHYICESTIGFLETQNFDPAETCVLVMWSGTSRKDLRISAEWYFYLKDKYRYLLQAGYNDVDYYLFSGGLSNSQLDDGELKKIFGWLYKLSDPHSLCLDSLTNMLKLESYLQNQGYNYAMTSFQNLWQGESIVNGDYCIPWFFERSGHFAELQV